MDRARTFGKAHATPTKATKGTEDNGRESSYPSQATILVYVVIKEHSVNLLPVQLSTVI